MLTHHGGYPCYYLFVYTIRKTESVCVKEVEEVFFFLIELRFEVGSFVMGKMQLARGDLGRKVT